MAHTGVFNVDGVGSNLEKYDGHDLTSATPSGSERLWRQALGWRVDFS